MNSELRRSRRNWMERRWTGWRGEGGGLLDWTVREANPWTPGRRGRRYKKSMSPTYPTWKGLNEERGHNYLLTWREPIDKNEVAIAPAKDAQSTYVPPGHAFSRAKRISCSLVLPSPIFPRADLLPRAKSVPSRSNCAPNPSLHGMRAPNPSPCRHTQMPNAPRPSFPIY
jgi:hypothetical protein